ncbi:MAG: amino acid permease [Sulfobacillus acidophilus]|uniref:Amino acid permease n=1 Tax=Sulfobacillus acidophilus TaxID=53633 RepID=A0A2T2WMN7_9FIRM|nr:MAG: amino acid permease [Sulfobacillus acidophilus]
MDIWRLLVGRPLRSKDAETEEIGTSEGLAALSLDALTSVAYGPEAIVLVLIAVGAVGLRYLLPISLAITGLLAILVLSYSQVIDAYPRGGGAYAVSKENLGARASLLAGAALTVDYTLTVAISISAGIQALTSAFPSLLGATLPLCLLLLAIITFLNLRGVGESARAFLLPTFLFIVGLLAVLLVGLVHPAVTKPSPIAAAAAPHVSIFFLMKAFAAGLTALTGVEAIANGVPLFRQPRQLRAKRTEWLLGAILACMLLGIALLTVRFGALPTNSQSLLSRVMTDAVGRNWAYYFVSLTIMVVLGLAANTSFGGLPVLFSLLAHDGYAPRSFAVRGDRLVFERGIFFLAIAAAALLVAVNGNTQALIPMYAIGVFTGFTLSQAGMVFHWRKVRPPGWKVRAVLNSAGAIATGISTILFVTTKFTEGAWVVVLAVPILIIGFLQVHRYYKRVGVDLKIGQIPAALTPRPRPIVVVPITPNLTELTRRALDHALSLSDQVLAVVVVFEGDDSDQEMATFRSSWAQWNPPVRLVELKSQYHSVVRPLLRFIQTVDRRSKQRVLVLIPEIVPDTWGQELLHNRMGQAIGAALRHRTDVMIGTVPMHLTEPTDDTTKSPTP